ncbi:MAG: DUF4332 domain-containing protein [Pseudomonadota bacterium]
MLQATLLFKILRAAHARGTHHKLALDALPHLRGPGADTWRNVFLRYSESYLEGAKAPDKEFKDFTNHVLHVRDGYWGGAAEKAMAWYAHTVDALTAKDWQQAVYAAGVMSHYYTDPIMPFHTAQSDAENTIHRAVEWSVSKSYDALITLARREFPMPDVPIEDRDDWLADLVCDAAELSNTFYDRLISDYDFDRGVVDPPSGLNARSQRFLAQLLAYAQVGQARILDRAFADAGVTPPETPLTAATVVAGLKIPVRWVLRRMDDVDDRRTVQAMYDELQQTGKVERTLPEDDRAVRTRFRADVGEVSATPRPAYRPPHSDGAFDYAQALSARAKRETAALAADDETIGTPAEPEALVQSQPEAAPAQGDVPDETDAARPLVAPDGDDADAETDRVAGLEHSSNADDDASPAEQLRARAREMSEAAGLPSLRFRLHMGDEVEDGPSVGPKTALRLNKIGIVTVSDLLSADPEATAAALKVSYIRPALVRNWQDQARLQCDVPELTGTAAQLIVGCEVRSASELAETDVAALTELVAEYAMTSEGLRLLRDRPAPDAEKIAEWVSNAGSAVRQLNPQASVA